MMVIDCIAHNFRLFRDWFQGRLGGGVGLASTEDG